jgi:hypothetical protein
MTIMIIEPKPAKLGKLALRLRLAHDAANGVNTQPVPTRAATDYVNFVTGSTTALRLASLNYAGIREKVVNTADGSDNEVVPITGDEVAMVFDDNPSAQSVATATTVMVIPTAADLEYLWSVDGIYKKADRKQISNEDYEELGRYLLKKCR